MTALPKPKHRSHGSVGEPLLLDPEGSRRVSAAAAGGTPTAEMGAGKGEWTPVPTEEPQTSSSPGKEPVKAPEPDRPFWRVMTIVGACTAWLAASSGIILANRVIMVELKFHYPMAVAAMGMAVSGFFAFIYCDVLRMAPPVDKLDLRFFFTRVFPIGAAQAVAMWLSNATYLYLTVAFIEMARSLLPVFTMLALYMASLEKPTTELVKSVALTALGCAIAAYGEVKLHPVGLLFQVGNFVMESGRLVLTQYILVGCELHPFQALKLVAPSATACLAVMSFCMERKAMMEQDAFAIPRANWGLFMLAACLGLVVNLLSNIIIKLSSATTVKVLAAVRGPMIVMSGVLLFKELVTPLEFVGYSITLCGFAWYNTAKTQQMLQQAVDKTKGST